MPDLRGLAANDARQILADVGVSAKDVLVTDQPAAGEAGLVLGQQPVYGYPVEGTVTLSVSTPAEVPEFAGRAATDVLSDLDELGAEVEIISRYVPGVEVGQVATITPRPGTLLPVAVTVVVAAEPEEVDLAALSAVDDNCYTQSDSLNGTQFANLLTCSSDRTAYEQSWIIKRAASRVSGVLGIPDSSEPRETMQLEILVDDVVVASYTAEYGATSRFDVDVTGALRLTLRFRSLTNDYATLGIGHLRLLGDAQLLKKLEQ